MAITKVRWLSAQGCCKLASYLSAATTVLRRGIKMCLFHEHTVSNTQFCCCITCSHVSFSQMLHDEVILTSVQGVCQGSRSSKTWNKQHNASLNLSPGQQITSKIDSFQNANFLISQPNPLMWPLIESSRRDDFNEGHIIAGNRVSFTGTSDPVEIRVCMHCNSRSCWK